MGDEFVSFTRRCTQRSCVREDHETRLQTGFRR
jgi:hypothetical protein